jgi:hypothetical protein
VWIEGSKGEEGKKEQKISGRSSPFSSANFASKLLIMRTVLDYTLAGTNEE